MFDKERLQQLTTEINVVLDYGSSWDAYSFLRLLRDEIKEKLSEDIE